MSASPALHYVNYAFDPSRLHLLEIGKGRSAGGWDEDPGHRVKYALRRAGRTVTEISSMSRQRFGEGSPYYIPPTFLHKQRRGITPHVCQVLALSVLTGSSFSDWMSLCGFDLRLIPAFQLRLRPERTTIITPMGGGTTDPLRREFKEQESIVHAERYVYAKIGEQDALARARFVPGNIVRADSCFLPKIAGKSSLAGHLWLVAHPGGLNCCPVWRITEDQILLMSSQISLPTWPLRIPNEAQILGLVDLCINPINGHCFAPCAAPEEFDLIKRVAPCPRAVDITRLLRCARVRAGLTFRSAHHLTREIAEALDNQSYAISLGLLSDYEALNKLPRHIAKIMSLCIIYGMDFRKFVLAANSALS